MSGFLDRLDRCVSDYRDRLGKSRDHLSLLRWQIAQGHALDQRSCYPGHVTTSAFVVSPDHQQILLIDHVVIGRWLQPGGHYEEASNFWQSALREAQEETGVAASLHGWHREEDLPFRIESHDVPGKSALGEPDHVHHDLQYLFVADPALPLISQKDEVHAARWHSLDALEAVSPKALMQIRAL
jgi:8-oxo-dGTP pyrophosphatase MutT (NUDIX family)